MADIPPVREESRGPFYHQVLWQMWRDSLRQIVAYYSLGNPPVEPTYLYDAEAPRSAQWPDSLPMCEGLREFYQICGRADIGPMIRFIPLEDLAKETSRWIELLRDHDARGDILQAGRHVVFANDADGAPWVWDSATGQVASFYWKGGDWEEPRFESFEDFMEHVLSPHDDDPSWARALEIYAAHAI